MAKQTFDELMREHAPTAYAEYENLLKLARDFGAEAVRQKLNNSSQNAGPNSTLQLIQKDINKLSNDIVKKVFDAVQLQLQQKHTPRADSPRAQNVLQNDGSRLTNTQQRLQQVPWMKNLDIAADPKARQAEIAQIASNINNPKAFTEQFANAVRQAAEARLVNRMKNMPQYKPKNRLER